MVEPVAILNRQGKASQARPINFGSASRGYCQCHDHDREGAVQVQVQVCRTMSF